MQMKSKVLVVEDERRWQDTFKRSLQAEGLEVILAGTIQAAETLFQQHSDSLAAILVDAQVRTSYPNTMVLIKEFKETYHGLIVGMSNVRENLVELRDAGCDYAALKDEVVEKTLELLGLG